MPYIGVDPNRRCSVCGGPITPKNKTGICTRNKECRCVLQQKVTGDKAGGPAATPENSQWLLAPAYDLDTGEEIVDQVAIDVAVEGRRRVRLTQTERKEVIRRMILGSWGVSEIAHHCGTIPARIEPIVNELGYEIVTDKRANGKRRTATIRLRREGEPEKAGV